MSTANLTFWPAAFALLTVACGVRSDDPKPASATIEQEAAVEGRGADTAQWWDALPRPEWAAFERVLKDDPWFEIYRIYPDVYAIYEPGQFEEVISFLIVGQDQSLLFDTGLGVATLRPVIEALTDRDVLVVNSHSHFDHIGGNYEFDRIAGVDDPYAKARQNGASNADIGDYLTGDWVWKPLPEGVDPKTFKINPFTVDETIADGDIIDLGGVTLEVVATPGHSPDSICLFDKDGRRLFMGDTFYLAPLYAHIEGGDFAAYKNSVDRLAALQPQLDALITAHNVPIAESYYLNRLKDAFDAIETGQADYVKTDGAYEYGFENFSIIAPPPAAGK